jgi:iron complex outermembrane receptor protein
VDLTELSIEELMGLEVEIASRHSQPLDEAPAAVYVLTGDEIRRAGHTSVQEALRMVPGFQVKRYGSSRWDITSRGFSGGFANQLQVMIDGVSVYTPLFAGVWWHLVDVDVADIDRIEVVRGPGASLWGANAVNGVVNVITKSAADTIGPSLHTVVADEERRLHARFGAETGRGAWRIWLQGADHDAFVDSLGDSTSTDWSRVGAGFRGDWELTDDQRLTVIGSAYSASIGEEYIVGALEAPPYYELVLDDTPKNGVTLSGAWETDHEDGGTSTLSAWYMRDHQKQVDFSITIDQLDLEYQRTHLPTDALSLSWGLGWRHVDSDLPGDFMLTFDPVKRQLDTLRLFGMAELEFPDAEVVLTGGASLEHNSITGYELQPTLRGLWTPVEDHTIWAGVSRSVRTPSLEEVDVVYNIPINEMGTFFTVLGSDSVQSEEQWAFEAGWRWQANANLALDLTAFYYEYDDIQTIEDGDFGPAGDLFFFEVFYDNLAEATSHGVELAADWDVTDDWRIRSAYTYFDLDSRVDGDSADIFFGETDESTPSHQVNVRSYYDLGADWELDTALYWVDDVEYFETPSYLRWDVRIGWQPSDDLRLALGVQNLSESQHPEETADAIGLDSEVERNVFFELSWAPR